MVYSLYRQPSNLFEEECSNDGKNSCIRQNSDASSDFFNLEDCSSESEDCGLSKNIEVRESTDLLEDLPHIESFIIPKKRDSFFTKFMSDIKALTKEDNPRGLLE